MADVIQFGDAEILAKLSQALDSQLGPYEWGKRDCLTTCDAIVYAFTGKHVEAYKEAWAMPEQEAMKTGLRRHESVLEGHRSVLLAQGLQEAEEPLRPGDIVLLNGDIWIGPTLFKGGPRRNALGFVTPMYEIWHWSPDGLAAVTAPHDVACILRVI